MKARKFILLTNTNEDGGKVIIPIDSIKVISSYDGGARITFEEGNVDVAETPEIIAYVLNR